MDKNLIYIMPLVSVLMTTYNRAAYLSQAIDSLVSQTFNDWELVVVDDCSQDNTALIINEYQKIGLVIKYIKNEKNLGIVQSRNLALSLCAGKYVAILDSDDVWTDKQKLRKQVEIMENNSELVLCGGMAKVIDEDSREIGKIIYQEKDKEIRKKILLRNQFIHSAVIYRKKIAEMIGGYGGYGVGEDYDLFLKLGLKGKFLNLPDFLLNYRRHPSGITWKNRVFSAKEHLNVILNYKGVYPNFYQAMLKAYLRIVLAFLKLI